MRRDISQPHKFEPFNSVPSMCSVYDSVRAESCSLASSNEIHKVDAAQNPSPATDETDTHFADCREGNHDECLYQFPDPANPSETLTCGCEHHLRAAQGDGQSGLLVLLNELDAEYANRNQYPDLVGNIKAALHYALLFLGNWPRLSREIRDCVQVNQRLVRELQSIRKWLIFSKDGDVEHTAWPERVAAIDAALTLTSDLDTNASTDEGCKPTDEETETARTIVKRCGIRAGLFKGPRTLNAVETIAYELANARHRAALAAVVHNEEGKDERQA